MVNVYLFESYKAFVKERVESLPKNGRGEFRQISLRLGVSTTMISQVFSGDKDLSLELASELCDYFGLADDETDYFLLLVDYGRAGSAGLKAKLMRRIRALQAQAKKLEGRLKKDVELSAETRAIYYSNWLYSGIRNLTALSQFNDAQEIADYLALPRGQVQKVLDFLLRENLLVVKQGKLEVGPQRTYLGAENPLVSRHHQNWRLLGFQKMVEQNSENLFYTGPMSLSKELAEEIRAELPAFIEKVNKKVGPSASEVVRCLNIDFFKY